MSSNAYLNLAEEIIRSARHPMSAKEIIQRAYLLNIIPKHLHGRTQHKTLTARISTDILEKRDRSLFFRPWPGRYFLREFMNDESLPLEYRTPIVARRRSRELRKEYAAFVSKYDMDFAFEEKITPGRFSRLLCSEAVRYASSGEVEANDFAIWNVSIVRRGKQILTYNRGKFKDGKEAVLGDRTLLFTSPLTHDDRTLFDSKFHGSVGASIAAVSIDLDLEHSPQINEIEEKSKLLGALAINHAGRNFLLALTEVRVPSSTRILTRRLAINNLSWLPVEKPRVSSDQYDDWSRSVIDLFLKGRE